VVIPLIVAKLLERPSWEKNRDIKGT
jgi:hypothetical protein